MELKKEFKYFSIFNHKKEEEYLRQQHRSGWKFVKVTGLGMYHFEKCKPEDVIYQLDFNQDSTANLEEYLRMFADCGWDYILEFAGYRYFRKSAAEMQGEEEIFSDDSSRLAMLERVYKGKLLPLLVMFSATLMPQFILNMVNGRYALATFFGSILLLYGAIFVYCAVHYHKQKK